MSLSQSLSHSVDGVKSEIIAVNSGVPQGSRLGPLLFIIYMNDIVSDIESDILIFCGQYLSNGLRYRSCTNCSSA